MYDYIHAEDSIITTNNNLTVSAWAVMRCMQMQGASVRSTWKWPSRSVTCLGCSQWDLISHSTGPCTHLLVWCSLLMYHPSLKDHKSAWQPLPLHPWNPNIWMRSEKISSFSKSASQTFFTFYLFSAYCLKLDVSPTWCQTCGWNTDYFS